MTDPDPSPARLPKAIADIYADAAGQLLELIARRLARGVTEPGWAEQKLAEITGLRDDARRIVDQLTATSPDEVRAVIDTAAAAGRDAAIGDLPGPVGSLTPVTNTPAVDALARETIDAVTGTHLQILRTVNDIYRSVIAETAAPGVVTGSVTTLQAAQRALDRFADKGITGFVDTAGRRWELESYVEMATRTASARAMIQGRLDVYTADGRDIVIVSDSPEECPLCRRFEGRLLSISGTTVGQTIDGHQVIDSVSGATSKGLFHANCSHTTHAYIAGLTKPQTGTGNPEGYEARQEQRRLERQVRKWKRREAVAMDDHAANAARAKVRAWQSRLKAHVDSHDLFRQPERERLRMRGATPTPGSPSIARTHLRSEINPSSVRGRQVTQALDAVEGVHKLPDMRGVTIIRGNGLPAETRGFYRRRTGTVALNPTVDATSVLVHELGHVVEHRTGGGIGSALASNPALRAAIEGTPEVQRLRAMLSTAGPGRSTIHLAYLLEDGEVWARAYSQYIAEASDNKRLRMDLKRVAGLPSGRADRYRQWSDESFQSIAPLVRDVLKDWGLL